MNFLLRLLRQLMGTASPPPAPNSPLQPSAPGEPTKKRTLNLDAGDFLPITRDELVKAASGGRGFLWGSGAWFGRRDLIPPADDARTKLIDRALVTHGLLSPEEVVKIHEVGAEMDRVRPHLAAIQHKSQQAGEAAVQQDREQRARIKEQKKKESAERKRLRAQAISERRTTDIIFLGRGVSGRLGQHECDQGKLAAASLPVLGSPSELATALGITIPRLRWLSFHAEVASRVHYVSFTIPKKSGGVRTLNAPHRDMAGAQRWIFENIVQKLSSEPAAHGFIRGRGIVSNAQEHVGRAVVVNMDLEAFFPSITFPRVRSLFQRLGYSPAVATILALLCTECPRQRVEFEGKPYHVAVGPRGLPQGACTSPGIANQIARRLDKRLNGIATKMGATFTRYADDLSFSGNAEVEQRIGYLMARVRHIAEEEGFRINSRKNRVLRRNSAQRVTGLVVNDRVGVSRRGIRRLRAILHRARKEGLVKQNREGRDDFVAWLQGKIAYVAMVQPAVGDRFQAQLKTLLEQESLDTGV